MAPQAHLYQRLGGRLPMDTARITAKLLGTAFDFILPPRCTHCRRPVGASGYYCPSCWGDCQHLTEPCCALCGYPFDVSTLSGDICAQCLAAPPAFDWCRSAFGYGGPVRSDILRLKHGRQLLAAQPLGRAMAGLLSDISQDAVLLPIPLHPSRLRRRRFNQAMTLARAVASRTGLRVRHGLLRRKRATPTQAGLGRKARARNVGGAFMVTEKRQIAGRHVILVDDVYTTGATLNSAARTLSAAGAEWIGAVTAARVVLAQRTTTIDIDHYAL